MLLAALAACGSPTGPGDTPPPPPVETVALTCPANLSVDSPTADLAVTFTPPVVSGGTPPVTTACTKTSGDVFAEGTTPVSCTARDNLGRAATCSFTVTVSPTYMLRGTRFTAVGDSITEGKVSDPRAMNIRPDVAYPRILEGLLSARYKKQVITVAVFAQSGQKAEETWLALRAYLQTTVPDALLILTGTNNATGGALDVPDLVAESMRRMLVDARAAGVQMVFASTLLPMLPSPQVSDSAQAIIGPTNDRLRATIAAEGGVLVDNYAALIGEAALYIGQDGLHPTEAGHRKIAETFFDAIVRHFEVPLATMGVRRR